MLEVLINIVKQNEISIINITVEENINIKIKYTNNFRDGFLYI